MAIEHDHTSVTDQAGLLRAITHLTRRIEHRLTGSGLTLVPVNGTSIHTRLQAIFNDRPGDPAERVLHEVIMNHAVMAEKMGPGGFDACLRIIVDDLRVLSAGGTPVDRSSLLDRLENVGGRPTRGSDIARLVDECAYNASDRVRVMLKRALTLAGFGGRVVVERAVSVEPSVELVRGYTFELDPAWPVSATLKEPRVATIDGFVESVGELNGFLERAHTAKEPVCLFVRGLAPDVVSTLRVNYDRGTLMVVPIIVRFDVEGINVLKDIAVVAGCDVVSSAKGDLISTVAFDECPRVEQATLGLGKVVLVGRNTRSAVDKHVTALRMLRADQHNELGRLLDMRIRSLSSNHVVLRLPDDSDFVRNSQVIDCALRSVGAAVDRGIVDDPGVPGVPAGVPVGTVVGAVLHAGLCVNRLRSLGAVITFC